MTATIRKIDASHAGQRLDNFLLSCCKGVPKTRIYKAIRKGEVRVNQKRAKPDYRLEEADEVRIPPFRVSEKSPKIKTAGSLLNQIDQAILKETNSYLVVNKPSGIPVHGGTGINTGLIEALRELRPQAKFLELVHRIDKETSGCLMVAKKRSVLVQLHKLLLHKKVQKRYLALVMGRWPERTKIVSAPLRKNQLAGGERLVIVDDETGKSAQTRFRPVTYYKGATLVEAEPLTGRTHQIRVHATHIGHPIAGDSKYGDRGFNKSVKKQGLNRLFLHASHIACQIEDEIIDLTAPLPDELQSVLSQFDYGD